MLDDLKIFIQVVEAGNVAKAAQKLTLNPSTVSRKLKALEETLNISLIKRDINNLELTDEGRAVYDEFKPIIHQINAELENISIAKQGFKGSIRIMVAPELCAFIMTKKFYTFIEQFPDLKIEFIHNYCQNNGTELAFDIGLSFVYPPRPYTTNKMIIAPSAILCASKKYVEKYGAPKTLEELHNHHHVLHSFSIEGGSMVEWIAENKNGKCQTIEFTKQRITTNNMAHNRQLLRTGYGIVFLLNFMSKEIQASKDIVRILPDYTFYHELPIYLVKASSVPSVKVDAFINFITDSINELRRG